MQPRRTCFMLICMHGCVEPKRPPLLMLSRLHCALRVPLLCSSRNTILHACQHCGAIDIYFVAAAQAC